MCLLFGYKMNKGNHQFKMYPVFDKFGWVVGNLCDCGYFEFRKDIPNYQLRLTEFIKAIRGKND
jgi:hypothetical protein